ITGPPRRASGAVPQTFSNNGKRGFERHTEVLLAASAILHLRQTAQNVLQHGNKLCLPKTLEDLKEIIEHNPLCQEITLQIDKHENIAKTTEILSTYFQFEDLPPYIL
ncbi:19013_t:CDS:2, partial [Gigaspora rosea]